MTARSAVHRALFLLALLLTLGGCAGMPGRSFPAPSGTEREAAEAALFDYFTALNEGRYADAVPLYGGTYEVLEGYNPEAPADDLAGLLAAGCSYNGLMCLDMEGVLSREEVAPGVYRFVVRFLNPDGTPFVLGPCCGATEEEMPPVSEFPFTVARGEDGAFRVLELPPYVP